MDQFLQDLIPSLVDTLQNRADTLQTTIQSEWVNPANAVEHKDGTPSTSMGASSSAIAVGWNPEDSRLLLEFTIDGSFQHVSPTARTTPVEDYYKYARISNQEEGESLRRAKDEFTRKGRQISDDAWGYIRARLDRLEL